MQVAPGVTQQQLTVAVLLDLALGDPPWLPHPVRAIGFLAHHAERFWRATGLPLRPAGVLFWSTVVLATTAAVSGTGARARTYWIYSFLACRDLDRQATAVVDEVTAGHLSAARMQLSRIVGRDTASLEASEIVRAALETVAENASDGVIAPLFYLAVGGPALMAFYKAVNTLDSMVGYRNTRYEQFGWWSARADDVLNWIPARLTALLVSAAAGLSGLAGGNALRIALRDGSSQPSPNAGYPEAAFAGALQVQLGGLNYYDGVPSRKPFLGDAVYPITSHTFTKARRVLYSATALFVVGLLLAMRRGAACR